MEATTLSGDKQQRIVDAMRASVAARGAAGSTFDHVAREAGVSRGLLHYYFGTKERLLVEVVRRDSDLRLAALDTAIGSARTADDLLAVLVSSLEDLVERDPSFGALHFELFTSARRTGRGLSAAPGPGVHRAGGWPNPSSRRTRRPRSPKRRLPATGAAHRPRPGRSRR